jgi:glycosyltransferase involved in cell wall biosynthesis
VNRGEHEHIRDRARQLLIAPDVLEIVSASYPEVPLQIARMTAAMALIKPSYSKVASAPTKIAEYLGCGVPCLGNRGVGDVEQVLEGNRVGVAARGFSDASLATSVQRLLDLLGEPAVQNRCRNTAVELFSIDRGVAAYEEIYRSLQR